MTNKESPNEKMFNFKLSESDNNFITQKLKEINNRCLQSGLRRNV